ncbi:MAG: LptF/LptG family permease [Planctomycetaceae bacterium]|nr:LptF/LptG family permease [Planctomycetaceae bacterium]
MIIILHRYVFRELFRVFVLATVALTLMLSVGLLVPTIQEYGVSPGQILHLLGYFMPITLTFVLPMSALFSASLIYGRLAADRELDACRASGISMRTLLYPGLMLAILVAVANLALSFHVAPAFIYRSEKSVKANAEQILFRNIQKKGFYALPGSRYRLYADRAIPDKNLLEGVVIVDARDDKRQTPQLITTDRAKVLITTHGTYHDASIMVQNAYQFDEIDPVYIGTMTVRSRFQPLLSDNIKFQKIEQLKRIQANKLNFYPIYDLAMQTRAQLAIEMLAADINRQMQESKDYYQLQDVDQSQVYLLSVGGCQVDPKRPKRINFTAPIQLLQVDKLRNAMTVKYNSQQGYLSLENEESSLRLGMILENPTWQRQGQSSFIATRRYVSNIRFPDPLANAIGTDQLLPLLEKAGASRFSFLGSPTPLLIDSFRELQRKLIRVDSQILAEIHSRLVLGLGCVALILMGIALGVGFKGGHVLSAFGASAIPAGLLVVFILSGKELTKNPSVSSTTGVAVMWSGLVVLIVLTFWTYRKLLRT